MAPSSVSVATDAVDRSWYVLAPGNYGGIPTNDNSLDQLPLYDGLTPLRGEVADSDIEDLFLAQDFESGRFVTMFLGQLDAGTGVFRYSSAGHGEGLLCRAASGEFVGLESTGPPLAVIDEMEFPEGESVTLEPGDLLVVTTDGVEEAMDSEREQFGIERLQTVIADGRAI